MTAANWISDGTPVPEGTTLLSPPACREWHVGRYEIALAPRRGRWSFSRQGEMTSDGQGNATMTGRAYGAAGYRTPFGAALATWRIARRIARSDS